MKRSKPLQRHTRLRSRPTRKRERMPLGHLECHDGKWSWIAGPDTRELVA